MSSEWHSMHVRSEDNTGELVLSSLLYIVSRDLSQDIKLVHHFLYPLS